MEMRYDRPTSVEMACRLLADPGAVPLAGGTDFAIRLRNGNQPALVVDLKRIVELTEINWSSAGDLSIGAGVTMRQLYEDEKLAAAYPGLTEGARAVGSLQIRCRATVGGNLCNASPCMDTAPALLVLGATLVASSASGEREIPITEFFLDVKKTALKPGEMLTRITVPAARRVVRTAFGKVKRVQGHDLALVNAAVGLDPEANTLQAAIGSCGATPVVSSKLSDVAADVETVAERLAADAIEHICPIDDVRASAEYRRDMAAHLCKTLTRQVFADVQGGGR